MALQLLVAVAPDRSSRTMAAPHLLIASMPAQTTSGQLSWNWIHPPSPTTRRRCGPMIDLLGACEPEFDLDWIGAGSACSAGAGDRSLLDRNRACPSRRSRGPSSAGPGPGPPVPLELGVGLYSTGPGPGPLHCGGRGPSSGGPGPGPPVLPELWADVCSAGPEPGPPPRRGGGPSRAGPESGPPVPPELGADLY